MDIPACLGLVIIFLCALSEARRVRFIFVSLSREQQCALTGIYVRSRAHPNVEYYFTTGQKGDETHNYYADAYLSDPNDIASLTLMAEDRIIPVTADQLEWLPFDATTMDHQGIRVNYDVQTSITMEELEERLARADPLNNHGRNL